MNNVQLKFQLVSRVKYLLMGLLLFSSFVFATPTIGTISGMICAVYTTLSDLLPILAFVALVLAGISYAAGQFLGAETRAKAQGYAMSLIVGAIIAFVLAILGPKLIVAMYGSQTICTVGIS